MTTPTASRRSVSTLSQNGLGTNDGSSRLGGGWSHSGRPATMPTVTRERDPIHVALECMSRLGA